MQTMLFLAYMQLDNSINFLWLGIGNVSLLLWNMDISMRSAQTSNISTFHKITNLELSKNQCTAESWSISSEMCARACEQIDSCVICKNSRNQWTFCTSSHRNPENNDWNFPLACLDVYSMLQRWVWKFISHGRFHRYNGTEENVENDVNYTNTENTENARRSKWNLSCTVVQLSQLSVAHRCASNVDLAHVQSMQIHPRLK